MAIVRLPSGLSPHESLVCAICGGTVMPSRAAAGPQAPDGTQEFICERHMLSSRLLVRSFAEFAIACRTADDPISPLHYATNNLGSA